MKRPAKAIVAALLLTTLGTVALSACSLLPGAGPRATPDSDPFAVLVSTSPSGDYTVQVLVDREEQPDGALEVRLLDMDGTDLGLDPAHIDYWNTITRPDHLLAWIDGQTLLWNGRTVLDAKSRVSSPVPPASVAGVPSAAAKGTGWLDAAYSPDAKCLAELWVGDGQLRLWITPLAAGADQPRLAYTYEFPPEGTEVTGNVAWLGRGEVFVGVSFGGTEQIVRVRADEPGLPVSVLAEIAYGPAVSPDGRYLAYTNGREDSVYVLDLETSRFALQGLPGRQVIWSNDSSRIAVRSEDAWLVYSLAGGKVIASSSVAGRVMLVGAAGGQKFSYAALTIRDGIVERVEIRQFPLP